MTSPESSAACRHAERLHACAGAGSTGHGASAPSGDVGLSAFVIAQNLGLFVADASEVTPGQIEFPPLRGSVAFGHRDALLPKACDALNEADRMGKLVEHQAHKAPALTSS